MRFVPYQLRWLADASKQKAVVKSRRIGFSEVAKFECACRMLGIDIIRNLSSLRPIDQTIVSASQAQAKKFLDGVKLHVRGLGLAMPGDIIIADNAFELKLANGATATAFSTNPDSIRGEGGDVTLDEFGAMPRPEKIWKAVQPIAARTLGNREGYRLRIIGTPEGDDNMFWRIMRGNMRESFSRHEVDVYTAKAQGFPIDIEEAKTLVGDADAWAQEYECCFLAASMRYIDAAIWDNAVYYEDSDVPLGVGTMYGGMDVAKGGHQSAIFTAEQYGDTLWHRSTEAANENDWDVQEHWVHEYMTEPRGLRRLAVDKSGLGDQFAQRLGKRYGSRIMPVGFTLQSKEEMATGLKLALQKGRLRPRADDSETRSAVLSLRRVVTRAANVRYEAPETKGKHADRAFAAALCVMASGGATDQPGSDNPVTTRGGEKRRPPRPVERSRKRLFG